STDLQAQTSNVSFAAGQASAVVNFHFINDAEPEQFEMFLVGFVPGQNINIGTPSQAELGIIDDDSISSIESTTSINVISSTSNAKSISTIIPTTSTWHSSSRIIPSYSITTSLITVTSSMPVDDGTDSTDTAVSINVGITVALVISGLINIIFIILAVSVLLYLKTSNKSLTNNRSPTEASNMVYDKNDSYELHKITNETDVYEDVKDI
uniref:Uncharacterized protein n=1 Tax=Amphimedon queenslandica TaxID=400682 RepID=A0A1X7SNZ0_AMPQE